jgi:CheY-like chemotaxis protein
MRVLILDDEPARQTLLGMKWANHDVVQAWTASEAILALNDDPFDVVSLDHDLGPASRGDGTRVARYIAAMTPERRPAVALVHSANPVGAKAMMDILARVTDARRIDPLTFPEQP